MQMTWWLCLNSIEKLVLRIEIKAPNFKHQIQNLTIANVRDGAYLQSCRA